MKRSKGTSWSAEDDRICVEAARRGISWKRIRGLLSAERSIASVKMRHWLLTANTDGAKRKRAQDNVQSTYAVKSAPVTAPIVAAPAANEGYDLILYAIKSNLTDSTKKIIVKTLAEQL